MVRWFWDDDTGAFFDTASDHEALVTRPRDITDNATPSGTSLAAELLARLADLLQDETMLRRARRGPVRTKDLVVAARRATHAKQMHADALTRHVLWLLKYGYLRTAPSARSSG